MLAKFADAGTLIPLRAGEIGCTRPWRADIPRVYNPLTEWQIRLKATLKSAMMRVGGNADLVLAVL